MRCDDATTALAEVVDGTEVAPGPARDHLERCLRCQAEMAQHRKVRRAMAQLREQLAEPAPDLLVQLLAAIDAAAESRAQRSVLHRHRTAYVAAAATAATAATAAGAVVLASRSRRTRLSPTG